MLFSTGLLEARHGYVIDVHCSTAGDKMSSNSSAEKAGGLQQQLLFANSPISDTSISDTSIADTSIAGRKIPNHPALPRDSKSRDCKSLAQTTEIISRQIKPPAACSPLAQQHASLAAREVASTSDVSQTLEREPNPVELIQSLQNQIRKLETGTRRADVNTVSTGCDALDQLLPENGLVRGTIIEWLADGPGNSAATLALIAARNACYESEPTALVAGISGTKVESETHGASAFGSRKNQNPTGSLIVVDPQHLFYPPAAAAWGIDLKNTIVLRPNNAADQNWALQQSLACPAVAAVWAVIDEIDERSFRRFQLAAEQSGCLGLFHRPAHVRHQPSWSEVQLAVRPLPSSGNSNRYHGRRLRVQLLKSRSGAVGRRIEMEINEATGAIRAATGPPINKPPAKKTIQTYRAVKHG